MNHSFFIHSIRELLHIGARHGGCTLIGEEEFCSVPSERWGHLSAIFDDDTMIVYGGYSHRCLDYCDDVWVFDLRDNTWHEIFVRGHFLQGLYTIHSFCSEDISARRDMFSVLVL